MLELKFYHGWKIKVSYFDAYLLCCAFPSSAHHPLPYLCFIILMFLLGMKWYLHQRDGIPSPRSEMWKINCVVKGVSEASSLQVLCRRVSILCLLATSSSLCAVELFQEEIFSLYTKGWYCGSLNYTQLHNNYHKCIYITLSYCSLMLTYKKISRKWETGFF